MSLLIRAMNAWVHLKITSLECWVRSNAGSLDEYEMIIAIHAARRANVLVLKCDAF